MRDRTDGGFNMTDLTAMFQAALGKQNWPAALTLADDMAAAMPKNQSIQYNRALVLKKLNRLDDACQVLEGILEVEPQHNKARFELASARLERSEFQSAIALFEDYLVIDRDDPDALLNLGNALIHSGRADLALTHLHRAQALSPSNLAASALAVACRDTGDLESCEAWLSELGSSATAAALQLKIRTQGAKGRIALAADQADRDR